MTNANSLLTVEKRRLEGDVRGMQAELDNLMIQVKNGEEKARKAMVDAGKTDRLTGKKTSCVLEMRHYTFIENIGIPIHMQYSTRGQKYICLQNSESQLSLLRQC